MKVCGHCGQGYFLLLLLLLSDLELGEKVDEEEAGRCSEIGVCVEDELLLMEMALG